MGGGGWAYSWGPQDDDSSVSAVHRALDHGIDWIDTAAVYGLGHSEEVVARALAGRPDSAAGAKRPLVFTKCSMVWDDKREVSGRLKAGSVRKECEDSLRRLKTDTIDLYQIHWPNPDEDIEEAWTEIGKLIAEGKVARAGVSNFNVAQLERAHAIAPVASLQPPYSMLRRGIEAELLPWCLANGVGVIVYSPMLSGLLTGAMTKERAENLPADDWRRNNKEFQEPNLTRNLELVEVLRGIGAAHGRSPAEVALAWTLKHPAVTGAIVGARSPEQVDGFAGALMFRLTDAEYAKINTKVDTLHD